MRWLLLGIALWFVILPAKTIGQTPTPPFDLKDPEIIERGRVFFNGKCNGYCHGKDAREGIDGPSLHGRGIDSPAFVFLTVSHGRPGTAMPPWKDRISTDEIWLATAFVMSLQ